MQDSGLVGLGLHADEAHSLPTVGYSNTRRTRTNERALPTPQIQKSLSLDSAISMYGQRHTEPPTDRASLRKSSSFGKGFTFFKRKSPKKEKSAPNKHRHSTSITTSTNTSPGDSPKGVKEEKEAKDEILPPFAREAMRHQSPYADLAFEKQLTAPTGSLSFNLSWYASLFHFWMCSVAHSVGRKNVRMEMLLQSLLDSKLQ
jgi:hypothetical protein